MARSNVMNAATSGYACRSFHSAWQDVNPIRHNTKSREEQFEDYVKFDRSYHAGLKRTEGKRILPDLTKQVS